MAKTVLIAIPVLLIGGTEIQTLNLVSVLAEEGYKVTVCCYYEYDNVMVAAMRDARAEVMLMRHERANGLWHLAKGLMKMLKMLSPDVVHIQYIAPGFIPVLAAKLAGVKTIFATVHQPGNTYGLKARLLLRTAASICTTFFCVSRAAEESWFDSSELFDAKNPNRKRKHFTIYNAVDIDRMRRVIAETDRDALKLGINDKKVIGFVGRLRWEKGLDILIDALPHILKSHPDAVLLVVGGGPDRVSLEQRAKRLGLSENIIWAGQKSAAEVYSLYSVMDFLVVPSRFEGYGLVAAEAMAAGLPVVATKVDGLPEVIEDNVTGILVPPSNSLALATAISELLANQDRSVQMGQKSLQRVREHFSLEKFRQSILAAYEALSA